MRRDTDFKTKVRVVEVMEGNGQRVDHRTLRGDSLKSASVPELPEVTLIDLNEVPLDSSQPLS